jgi:hypothetical protein
VSRRTRRERAILTRYLGLNCQKNAVVCEGYPEKTLWQPGKQRSEEGKIHAFFFFLFYFQRLLRFSY